ncbi:DUF4198 domain-containing protein [Chitinophaga sp. MM2321]|uniref:DUF4198 domain-containing protein n=1 Tax=Chitinophaga sp. MM2321 TaxID=3137178 RepID=UPI0032D599AF
MKTKILLSLLLVCCCSSVFAHMLWIEASSKGVKGKQQEVKVYYGEYTEHAPEKIDAWYSDVKSFTLWLISPDNKKTALTCTTEGDHFTTNFTPSEDGIYTLAISHNAKDLGGTTLYQFNATARVAVGKSAVVGTGNHELTANVTPGKTYKVKQQVAIKSLFKDQPTDKIQVAVFSPSGWNCTVVTDANGEASFVPLWPGTYMLEATKMNKEDGALNDIAYKGVWRNATIAFEVEK